MGDGQYMLQTCCVIEQSVRWSEMQIVMPLPPLIHHYVAIQFGVEEEHMLMKFRDTCLRHSALRWIQAQPVTSPPSPLWQPHMETVRHHQKPSDIIRNRQTPSGSIRQEWAFKTLLPVLAISGQLQVIMTGSLRWSIIVLGVAPVTLKGIQCHCLFHCV